VLCTRIGQTKDVKIYRLITRNTYEQKLFECSSRKYGLDEAILGNRLGADADEEQTVNIESLLKHGAYGMVKVVCRSIFLLPCRFGVKQFPPDKLSYGICEPSF
jgi:hypothetical protein